MMRWLVGLFAVGRISFAAADLLTECCQAITDYQLVPEVSWGTTPRDKQQWWATSNCKDEVGGSAYPHCQSTTTTTNILINALNPHVLVSNGADQNACSGFEEENVICPALPPCTNCEPQDCQMAEWENWDTAGAGNCNQICTRKRSIQKHNNACGKPCNSSTSETKRCNIGTCSNDRQDCKWGPWSAYSACTDDLAQQERSRSMTPAKNQGKSCTGGSKQTFPCGSGNLPLDCKFSQWHDWTACSTTCGMGQRTRARRWAQEAAWGGRPCTGPVQVIAECAGNACTGAQNCIASAWSDWAGCTADQLSQKFRVRSIQQPNKGGGLACPENIKETLGCPTGPAEDSCKFSAWLPWTACDKSCDGGQMRRSRTMTHWLRTDNMTLCPDAHTQETIGCNPSPCTSISDDCILEAWSAWGNCKPSCGTGMQERSRKVAQEAKPDGKGCVSPLEELRPCNSTPCTKRDCVWGQWESWGACTTSCGGGTHHRSRKIEVKPRHGGKACNEVAGGDALQQWPWSQIAPCNIGSCAGACINGTWGVWNDWSHCSATCDFGFRSRRRDFAQVPNACGLPAEGPENEITTCKAIVNCTPKVDCLVSKFSDWSACSSSCFGTQNRQRLIENYASGGGIQCVNETLKEIRPCNPGSGEETSSSCAALPKHDCTTTTWGQWADCPVSCGGGQHTRARRIIQPPSGGGISCNGTLTMTRSCNKNKCGSHCINCKWGQWDTWGACSKCGGQRYRTRRVEQLPNHCGVACLSRVAQETAACPEKCEPDYWCIWATWSPFTACSGSCGNVTKQRQRSLEISREVQANGSYLFKSHKNLMCAGTQFAVSLCNGTQACAAVVCTPVNCVMGAWSAWGAPQETGLCQRNRIIATNNNECGATCGGDLIETKVCIPPYLKPQDCQLSNWGQWSHCPSMLAQRYKIRGVFRQAANGGTAEPCTGNLRETVSCKHTHAPIDCGLTDWSPWGSCTRTCGGGWMYRTRQGNHPAQQFGGSPCDGGLKEVSLCNTASCDGTTVDCILGPWSTYGVCFQKQKSRFRGIEVMANGLRGKGCIGALEDTAPCGGEPVNCQVSAWTAWDPCDLSCGGGQQNRHRTIFRHPRNGGLPCPQFNKETQGCNIFPCTGAKHCILGTWSAWTACDTNCGIGQKNRKRAITQFRTEGGTGCLGDLEESSPCGTISATPCPVVNCAWGNWKAWTTCSKDCGSGWQSRTRAVATPAGPLGKPCEAASMRQAKRCNQHSCTGEVCTDGQWDVWGAWEACTATCGGGVQWRKRNVKVTANHCGDALEGDSQEVRICNDELTTPCADDNQPCVFGTWQAWSTCSEKCNGVTERKRNITKYGTGAAGGCNGTLSDVSSCHPAVGEARPKDCPAPAGGPKKDCAFGNWANWLACTHTCGGGTKNRSRTIATPAENNGKPCEGSTFQVLPCNHQLCPNSEASVNCKWGEWASWGVCDSCNGKQTRQRSVIRHGLRGGRVCEPGNAQEVQACDPVNMPAPFQRYCGVARYCVWAPWGAWSACATCGNSSKTRKRNLQASAVDPYTTTSTTTVEMRLRLYDQDLTEVTAMRQVRVAKQGQTHAQELIMAFAAGGASLFLVLTAMRACGSRQSLLGDEGIRMASPDEGAGVPLVSLE